MTLMIEVGTGLEKGHFPEAIITKEIGVHAIVGPGQDQEQVLIETEYNGISVGNVIISQSDCSTSREVKERTDSRNP